MNRNTDSRSRYRNLPRSYTPGSQSQQPTQRLPFGTYVDYFTSDRPEHVINLSEVRNSNEIASWHQSISDSVRNRRSNAHSEFRVEHPILQFRINQNFGEQHPLSGIDGIPNPIEFLNHRKGMYHSGENLDVPMVFESNLEMEDIGSTAFKGLIRFVQSRFVNLQAHPLVLAEYTPEQRKDPAIKEKIKHTRIKDKLFLTEDKVKRLLTMCEESNDDTPLATALHDVFIQVENLGRSFLKDNHHIEPRTRMIFYGPPRPYMEVSRELRVDTDETSVDVDSLKRTFNLLFPRLSLEAESTIVKSIGTLAENIYFSLRIQHLVQKDIDTVIDIEKHVNAFLILLHVPYVTDANHFDTLIPSICKAASILPVHVHARLARVIATHCKDKLDKLVHCIQNVLTLRAISEEYHDKNLIQDDRSITSGVIFLNIMYYANILAGEMSSERYSRDEGYEERLILDRNGTCYKRYRLTNYLCSREPFKHPLKRVLNVNPLDSVKPYIPLERFYNETVNNAIDFTVDVKNYMTLTQEWQKLFGNSTPFGIYPENPFTFLFYPFILNTSMKAAVYQQDNRMQMGFALDYFTLKVTRENMLHDALKMINIALSDWPTLKKQLEVYYEGEQGHDQGGLSKEFFQLAVPKLFNSEDSIFVPNEETNLYWFKWWVPYAEHRCVLVGILLGLAVYNNIYVNIKFPRVFYKKLLGRKGTFHDLEDFSPSLYNGLKEFLAYEGDDIEDVFMQTFSICVQFNGRPRIFDLMQNGGKIPVTKKRRQEFVDLYANFLLNDSIKMEFDAFREGFLLVVEESPIYNIFTPKEYELIICGSDDFDILKLKEATVYDGYTSFSDVIRNFWDIVIKFNNEWQHKLLQFITGTDRTPLDGLGSLQFTIARYGADQDRLPASHTCFNVLLLPEYDTREKLEQKLLRALENTTGFYLI